MKRYEMEVSDYEVDGFSDYIAIRDDDGEWCRWSDVEPVLAENAGLKALLAAVRTRCEANNWMGTARLCDLSSPLDTDAISASSVPEGS